jgi:hypothetical protein
MSEDKLKVQQKLFAAIEGMVKETRIKEVPLHFLTEVKPLTFSIDMKERCRGLDFSIPLSVTDMEFSIKPRMTCIVEEFAKPRVEDAAIAALETTVTDEPVEMFHSPTVFDADPGLTTGTRDFFKSVGVDKKLKYNVSVKKIDLTAFKPKTYHLNFFIRPILRDNLGYFNRFTVAKKPVMMWLLAEKEQLHYWKKAVLKTRKDPRKLKLVAVYPGIPRDMVENIKINYASKCLNYNFKTSLRLLKKDEPLKDMALFKDLETGKSIMVSK